MSTFTAPAPMHRTGWTITEGIVLVVIGLAAVLSPLVAAELAAAALPWVLLIEGIVLLVSAFQGRTFGSAIWFILLGVLALIAAAAVFSQPFVALFSLPVILGTYLIVKGILQFATGASATTGKGWIYTAAVLNIVFALLVFAAPFGTSLVITGLYVGLSILFLGVMLLALPGTSGGEMEAPTSGTMS